MSTPGQVMARVRRMDRMATALTWLYVLHGLGSVISIVRLATGDSPDPVAEGVVGGAEAVICYLIWRARWG